jgi:hypothetical protein
MSTVDVYVVNGVEGPSLYLNDLRVAGPKPWGGGPVVHRFEVSLADIKEALGRPKTEVATKKTPKTTKTKRTKKSA